MRALIALFFFFQTDYSADGIKALDAHRYEEAAGVFAKAVAADPKDYAAHFHLALSDSMLKRNDEAIAEYKKVLELKPGLYEAELNLAIMLIRTDRPADAAVYLSQAVEQRPKELKPRVYWAEALLDSGDAVKAEAQYRSALELNPKAAAAEQGLARALVKQNRLADAAPHFRAAAQIDPDFRDALLELADLYERNHQDAEAIAIYRGFPKDPGAQEHLGHMLLEANRAEEAIAPLESAMQLDPTRANRLALATAYLFAKHFDKALPLIAQTVAADPANYATRMMYGRALRDNKQYDPASQQFFQATKLQPNSQEAWKELAGMLYMLEKYPESLGALDKAHLLGDDSPANYYFHALAYDKLKAVKQALENYREFLARANGKFPDEEWKAQQRAKLLERELHPR